MAKIEDGRRPLADLKQHPKNYNVHRGPHIERLAAKVRLNAFTNPFIITPDGTILAGHLRRLALLYLKDESYPEPQGVDPGWIVPCRVFEGTETQELAILAGDNTHPSEIEFDNEALTSLLAELQADGALEGSGYDAVALDRLIGELAESGEADGGGSGLLDGADPDEIPEAVETRCKAGDLWALGAHRLLCGDSTKAEDVARLMSGENASLVFTDPPYGIAYKTIRAGHREIANDGDAETAEDVTAAALSFCADAPAAFVCCDWRSLSTIMAAMDSANLTPKACIVWDKMRGVQNLDRFHKQHEFIVYAGPYGGQKTVGGDVWQCARDFDPDHPTPKPVELIVKALSAASETGQIVYDCFAGSGSTIIAGESTGRPVRAVEIDPTYADVILARWERATDARAELLERL